MSILKTIKIEITNLDTSVKKLRGFGFVISGALIFLGIIVMIFKDASPMWWWIVAAGIAGIGAVAPMFLKPFYILWMAVAIVVGTVIFRIFLLLSFYALITPLGFFMRIARGDTLDEKIDRSAKSYWHKRNGGVDQGNAEKLF
ncbi:MAG: hypothetical protein V1489_03030 [Candidatus Liptonbacteria bacterium]